jgi:hypothetical protein
MASILNFATLYPFFFVLTTMAVSFVLLLLAFILARVVSGGKEKVQMIALGTMQLLVALAFVVLIWKMGWWQAAGFTGTGDLQAWLVVLVGMVYVSAIALYAYTGDLRVPLPDKKQAALLAYQMLSGSLLEETVYRGLVLYTFLRLWGDTTEGILGSVGLSAVLFGFSHLTWAAFGKPLKLATFQSLGATLGGFIYGTIVVLMGSIWPAVLIHAAANAVVNIKILPMPDYHETVSAGWKYVILQIPAVLLSVYLLFLSAPFPVIPNTP